jgi:hypothetical protein
MEDLPAELALLKLRMLLLVMVAWLAVLCDITIGDYGAPSGACVEKT